MANDKGTTQVLQTYDAIMFLDGTTGLTPTFKYLASGDGVNSTIQLSTTGVRLTSLSTGGGTDQVLVADATGVIKAISQSTLTSNIASGINSLTGASINADTLTINGSVTDYQVDLGPYNYDSSITLLSDRITILESTTGSDRYLSAINFPTGTDVATFTVVGSTSPQLNLSRYNYTSQVNNLDSRVTSLESAISSTGSNVTAFDFNTTTKHLILETDTPATFDRDLSVLDQSGDITTINSTLSNHETRVVRLETIGPDSVAKSEQTITYAANITWDFATSYNKVCTLTGNTVLSINNAEDGDFGVIRFVASGAARNVTLPASSVVIDELSTTQTLTSGKTYLFSFSKRGSTYYWNFDIYG